MHKTEPQYYQNSYTQVLEATIISLGEQQGVPFSHFSGAQEDSEETLWIKFKEISPVFEAIRRVFNIQNPHAKTRKPCTLRIWRD